MAEVRCKYCGKKHALELEGVLRWYCPSCKRYQETVSVGNTPLTNDSPYVNLNVKETVS